MNDQLYGQPEPFDSAVYAEPPRRPVPRSRRLVVPVVLGLALVLGGFAGGYALASAAGTGTGSGNQQFGNGGFGDGGFGNGGFGNGGPGASFRPRNGGFGGGASGTVGSVSSDQMTITTQAGGSRIVLLTPTTTVSEVSASTKVLSDLASGQTVTVIGTSNPDGSVTATRVIIGDIGALGGFGRGFGGDQPNASPAPGSAS